MEEQRRRQYLQAMDIEIWERRDAPPVETDAEVETLPSPEMSGPAAEPVRPATVALAASHQSPAESIGDSSPPWLDEVPPPGAEWESLEMPADEAVPASGVVSLDWDGLAFRVKECTACALHGSRQNTVFGVGDRQARLMVIGEAPGAEEDRKGEPFVGRAGKLLDAMLLALGLQRDQVFIANILKCRPPDNRDPRPEEALRCEPFLQRQVALVRPRVILAVGRVAAQNLLKQQEAVGRMRGRDYHFGGIPVVVSYHPAYLLRSPDQKAKSWQDLQRVAKLLRT